MPLSPLDLNIKQIFFNKTLKKNNESRLKTFAFASGKSLRNGTNKRHLYCLQLLVHHPSCKASL